MNNYQLHVDTYSNTYTQKINGNPFQCAILFGNIHRMVKYLSIKNAQIPIGFYNVRSPYNTFIVGGTTYTITPGNYTTLSALNSAPIVGGGTVSSALGSFTSSSSTNIVTFTSVSGSKTFTLTPLLAFLGFTSTQSLVANTTLISTYPYTLTWDTYLNIYIENLGTSSLELSRISFKIPLNNVINNIIYWNEESQNKQSITVTNTYNTDRLVVTVYDRYGNLLNNNGVDWSFSFDMISDT